MRNKTGVRAVKGFYAIGKEAILYPAGRTPSHMGLTGPRLVRVISCGLCCGPTLSKHVLSSQSMLRELVIGFGVDLGSVVVSMEVRAEHSRIESRVRSDLVWGRRLSHFSLGFSAARQARLAL